MSNDAGQAHHGRMKRLSDAHYQGYAFVHWSMTIEDRRTGWLDALFHARFRETQMHVLCRHHLICLTYCLMPDHIHTVWAGLSLESDQNRAASFFRKYLNRVLEGEGVRLQKQTWDAVLRDEERERDALAKSLLYINENPVRANLVPDARQWQYSGCQVAGHPGMDWRDPDFHTKIWRVFVAERRRG